MSDDRVNRTKEAFTHAWMREDNDDVEAPAPLCCSDSSDPPLRRRSRPVLAPLHIHAPVAISNSGAASGEHGGGSWRLRTESAAP